MGIIRPQTELEKKDFKSLYENDPERKFKRESLKQEKLANKKGLPFAAKPALDEFNESIQTQAKKSLKLHGRVRTEDIILPKTDWAKYSDLKNFKLTKTKKVRDKDLSKQHKMRISIDSKEYQYIGYGNVYRIMEDGDLAIEKSYKKDAESKK